MQRTIGGNVALQPRHAAHLLLMIAVDHRQLQRAVALQLHGDIAAEFQRRGQQTGRDQQVAQQIFDRCGVVVINQHLLEGIAYRNQFAANSMVFEQITVQLVMIGHNFLSW